MNLSIGNTTTNSSNFPAIFQNPSFLPRNNSSITPKILSNSHPKTLIITASSNSSSNNNQNTPTNSSRDHRWSLSGMTALVTGGTRGIGFVTLSNSILVFGTVIAMHEKVFFFVNSGIFLMLEFFWDFV